ncbi:MAG: NmrA family NAD(P)-binding protein [Thermoanaerobaculia bacterium]
MKHLILGGTGTVGSLVVEGLLKKGESVRVLTRSAERAKSLPKGALFVLGDLQDPDTYKAIFADYDNLFLLNATGPAELQEGLAAVNEARRSGAKRVVYLSIHDVEKAPAVPHFAVKVAVENALVASGLKPTILRPNNFFQNDYWYKEALLNYGVYPQPIGNAGLSQVDARDIADAAVRALTEGGHEGRTYVLAGSEALGGNDHASIYSEALGKKIAYGGDDLAAWAQSARASLPAWAVYDYALMYAVFQASGLRATAAQLAQTEAILGRKPRSFRDFVKETAAAWQFAILSRRETGGAVSG